MKKLFFASALAMLGSLAATAQVEQGDRFLELGIGVGAAENINGTKGMFTQRLAGEWIIKDNLFNLFGVDFALGVGFQIDNAAGGRYEGLVSGKYDYYYTTTITKHKQDNGHGRPITTTESNSTHREGTGLAIADVTRDNLSLMPTVSLHGKVWKQLDVYATFGLGLGVMTNNLSNYEPTTINIPGVGEVGGLYKKDYYDKTTMPNGDVWEFRYSFNDADHAEWNKKPYKSKATFACAFYLGARYFINKTWGVNAQFGLISANVNKTYGNSYNILSFGATYSF